MAAVAGAAVALAPVVAGSAHKGAATLRRWSAAAARPAGRRTVSVCQQQPERRSSSVTARAAAAEVRAEVCVVAMAGQRAAALKLAASLWLCPSLPCWGPLQLHPVLTCTDY